jgi:hypothetical protein
MYGCTPYRRQYAPLRFAFVLVNVDPSLAEAATHPA